jgi:murein DD-endopeptidase MepM/ murein hydrolase activator NlpD
MGNYIIVEAINDYHNVYNSNVKLRFIYMHMVEPASTTNPNIGIGSIVQKGQLIGKVGNTGNSTGAHLHLGIIVDGGTTATYEHTMNPMVFFPADMFIYERVN